jgi:NADP-dependent 3-hydroxy acid dehydrogenase YdfG
MTATQQGTALITGASSGIGAVYADRLARRGFDLVLVARNHDRLQALAGRLAADTGRKIETIAADLTNKKDIARVEAAIRANRDLTMLVNNAGVGATAPLLAADIEKMEQMIAINVNAPTRLTYAAAPGFVARGAGTIVNISSIAAVSPETLNGVYGGSKAFVLAFSQSLQHELGDKGVRALKDRLRPCRAAHRGRLGAPARGGPQGPAGRAGLAREDRSVENVPEGPDAERVIRDLAQQGHGLIFTPSFGYMEPTLKVARDFPNVKFESITGYKTRPTSRPPMRATTRAATWRASRPAALEDARGRLRRGLPDPGGAAGHQRLHARHAVGRSAGAGEGRVAQRLVRPGRSATRR